MMVLVMIDHGRLLLMSFGKAMRAPTGLSSSPADAADHAIGFTGNIQGLRKLRAMHIHCQR